jgi:hypothetical protein
VDFSKQKTMNINSKKTFESALSAFSPYTKAFIFRDGELCCEKCASDNRALISDALETKDNNSSWMVIGVDEVHHEEHKEICAHCNEEIAG